MVGFYLLPVISRFVRVRGSIGSGSIDKTTLSAHRVRTYVLVLCSAALTAGVFSYSWGVFFFSFLDCYLCFAAVVWHGMAAAEAEAAAQIGGREILVVRPAAVLRGGPCTYQLLGVIYRPKFRWVHGSSRRNVRCWISGPFCGSTQSIRRQRCSCVCIRT